MGYIKSFVTLISLAIVTVSTYYFHTKKKKEIAKDDINEVIMFSENDTALRKSKYSRCSITTSMDRVLQYISKTRCSIDLCMYVFTSQDLTNAILKLNYKGVKIRIIIDSVMAYSSGSAIARLEKKGLEVRWIKSSNFMHHKFCIIDPQSEKPIVMTGSLNWTTQALFGNYENVLVTSQRDIVEQYKLEFERLWVLFKPIV